MIKKYIYVQADKNPRKILLKEDLSKETFTLDKIISRYLNNKLKASKETGNPLKLELLLPTILNIQINSGSTLISEDLLTELDESYAYHVNGILNKKDKKSLNLHQLTLLDLHQKYKYFTNIPKSERRKVGPFVVEYNPVIEIKPTQNISQQNFNFIANNNMYTKESLIMSLISDITKDSSICLTLSTFPYYKNHCLLIPDKFSGHPNIFTTETLKHFYQVRSFFKNEPIAMNSYLAAGTINHLHFHLFDCDFPIENNEYNWPAEVYTFNNKDLVQRESEIIDFLKVKDSPVDSFIYSPIYHVLDTKGRTYVFLKKHNSQLKYQIGLAELTGKFFANSYKQFESLTEDQMINSLHQSRTDK